MSDAFLVALVTGLCTLAASYLAHKVSADREDRRRAKDVSREKALERINGLYAPLLKALDPGPPYDEFYIDGHRAKDLEEIVENNELLASPDLLQAYWTFRRETDEQRTRTVSDWELYNVIFEEHEELKRLVGYGNILVKEGRLKKGFYWACTWSINKFWRGYQKICFWNRRPRKRRVVRRNS